MTKLKIMVIEDEAIVSIHLQASLEAMGYAVSAVAFSGEEAIIKAERHNPDMILMDINLGGEMNGVEAAKRIRALSNIPVIFISAYPEEKVLGHGKIMEPYGYLIKPFGENDLRAAIENTMAKIKKLGGGGSA